ncbi:LacI family DNA-binding transcriptional regulator [uncultured Maribacter sp.]|uniref:LacI family DNA-binding transcriptional regulator n=1 Tax=uncultured Maribacter sp. TaxID=431308 RepID=UPI00260C3722|nr:LacI family DNA-binding transcriptional regulator [uncultured Maribacter sp.]
MGIKQIAKLANVSIGTVDRVIHKRPGVSKETKAKILKIIEETGYTKNTTASRLKLASIKKIKFAVLLPETKKEWNYWKLPIQGINNAVNELKEMGVAVDFLYFTDSNTYTKSIEFIFLKEYNAIITVPFFKKESNTLLQKAAKKKTTVVFLDTEIDLEKNAHFIRQNSHQAGKVAGRLLYGLVGADGEYLVINKQNDKGTLVNNLQREDGFKEFIKSVQYKKEILSKSYIFKKDFNLCPDLITWLKTKSLKGIFVTNSKSHIIVKALNKEGITNTQIIGFDLNDKNINCLKNEEISFLINQQPELQGYMAIKNLFNHIAKQETLKTNYNIPIDIILKENLLTS